MKSPRVAGQWQGVLLSLALLAFSPMSMIAQDKHSHSDTEQTSDQKKQSGELLRIVRENTEKYKDVKAAEAAGYKLTFGCVTGDDFGAMGLHYVNFPLVQKGELDPTQPQIIIYEPTPDGPKLIGADFLVMAADWDAKHPMDPPILMGQIFHYFESPNRFGLPAFYTLHVWAWKENPKGAFVNWHPNVNCESFAGETNNTPSN